MKAVTVKELKQELNNRSPKEVLDLCLRLSRFKKENKELLTYLLFEASDEAYYVESVKKEIDQKFEEVNKKSPYFIRKSLRAILNYTKKYIRYSQNKETEVELLIYFCEKMKNFKPSMHNNKRVENIYYRLLETIRKKITGLHEDLQYDYNLELDQLSA
ncbi:MAG: hypothetical protein OEM04_10775 [Flavobacteriaceae bacterium]|nr:hypothetical protein [Flavobacteriaceae bacterium]